VSTCPRCGTSLEPGQEYCLGCGSRLPGRGLPAGERPTTGWVLRALAALAVAAGGAALAIAAGDGRSGGAQVVTATGGFITVPTASTLPSETPSAGAAGWPSAEDGWTIVLASFPQAEGRRAAALKAREARRRGLRRVGVLDSSSYASLRPGYWVVFTGIYTSEPEATSDLERARRVARTADVRRIVR
jgi:hypothetical protein